MLRLRPASRDDADRLREWRNEPGVRAASFNSEVIPPDEHRAWLERKLSDPDCLLFVVEEDGSPVGQVRLDLEDEEAEISLSLIPSVRGRRLGRTVISLAVEDAPATVKTVTAQVRRDNPRSISAFRAAGFDEVGRDERAITFVTPTTPR